MCELTKWACISPAERNCASQPLLDIGQEVSGGPVDGGLVDWCELGGGGTVYRPLYCC